MTKIIPKSNEIMEARIKSGLSFRDLSRKSKVHYSTISNIESKNKPVYPSTAKAICEALNKEFDQLFEIVDSGKESEMNDFVPIEITKIDDKAITKTYKRTVSILEVDLIALLERNEEKIQELKERYLRRCKRCQDYFFDVNQKKEYCSVKCRNVFNVRKLRQSNQSRVAEMGVTRINALLDGK